MIQYYNTYIIKKNYLPLVDDKYFSIFKLTIKNIKGSIEINKRISFLYIFFLNEIGI